MTISLPHTITNVRGETLTFLRSETEKGVEKLIFETRIAPGAGRISQSFLLQDQSLTVVSGKLGYQVGNDKETTAGIGVSVLFSKGQPYRFWNAGSDELICYGWIKPANNAIFFLTALFNAINEGEATRPEQFDTAYLLHRYRNEYAMPELPRFVRRIVIPATYTFGKLTGRYKKFEGAPQPL